MILYILVYNVVLLAFLRKLSFEIYKIIDVFGIYFKPYTLIIQ